MATPYERSVYPRVGRKGDPRRRRGGTGRRRGDSSTGRCEGNGDTTRISVIHPYFSKAQHGIVGRKAPSPFGVGRLVRLVGESDVALAQIGIARRQEDLKLWLSRRTVEHGNEFSQRAFQFRGAVVRSGRGSVANIDEHVFRYVRVDK